MLVHDFLVVFQALTLSYGYTLVVDKGLSLGCIPLASTANDLTSHALYQRMPGLIKRDR